MKKRVSICLVIVLLSLAACTSSDHKDEISSTASADHTESSLTVTLSDCEGDADSQTVPQVSSEKASSTSGSASSRSQELHASSVPQTAELPDYNFKGSSIDFWGGAGWCTAYNGYFYYSYADSLYRTSKDKTERVVPKLKTIDSKRETRFNCFFSGSDLYYSNYESGQVNGKDQEGFRIYKKHLGDNSKDQYLTDGCLGEVVGSWLYYLNDKTGDIVRIKTNGTQKEVLIKGAFEGGFRLDSNTSTFPDTEFPRTKFLLQADDRFVYYQTKTGVYKYNLTTKQITKLIDQPSMPFIVLNYTLYAYQNRGNILDKKSVGDISDRFYMASGSRSDRVYVDNGMTVNGWDYWMDGDERLYCSKVGSNQKTLLKEFDTPASEGGQAVLMGVVDGWIYYRRNDVLYKLRVDGKKSETYAKIEYIA